MAKFTPEDKLQAVLRYLNGKESYNEIGRFIATDHKSIVKWVKQYEYYGVEALNRVRP
ncbi:helix-turn-helix domain-containing protein [Paenisporosarcina indica]|uniref:helix-turn-helix domain-containing protein n=1 Tax=Paenisporosarcina indica TaxID=650093 RepID=UPI00094FA898|nr:helix-turn-helix domain-containing protein [Paenisporosarcina indica]